MVPKRQREPDTPYPSFLSHPTSTVRDIFDEITRREVKRLVNPKALVDHPEAVLRNRWKTILPWAYNRIHLRGIPYSYINASPMCLGDADHREHYIACQGPLDSSHMWRMVWEQEVSVIVMLTRLVEDGFEKCLQYYPEDERDIIDSGDFEVVLLEKSLEPCSEVRTLKIIHDGQERIVTHFLFMAWPDNDTLPETELTALFSVMQRSRDLNTSQKRRIIHCSAGVGRTGTFMALEHLMREMDRGVFDGEATDAGENIGTGDLSDAKVEKRRDAVFDTVDTLREQRMRVVVNLAQLGWIYEVLRGRWRERIAWKEGELERSLKMVKSGKGGNKFTIGNMN